MPRALLGLLLFAIPAAHASNGTLRVCSVIEMLADADMGDGSGVTAGEPCGNIIPNMEAMTAAISALNGGRGFAVGEDGSPARTWWRVNFTAHTFAHGYWSTEGRNLSRALFPQCHFVINMGSGCPGPDAVFIEQAAIARDAGVIAMTNRGPPEVLETAQNDHFFSIHLNSEEYPTNALKQFEFRAEDNVKTTVAVVGERDANFFFKGLTEAAARFVNESKSLDLVLFRNYRTADNEIERVEDGVLAAIAKKADVLVYTGRTPGWARLLNVTHDRRVEHVFRSIWAPQASKQDCATGGLVGVQGDACRWAVGGDQILDEETRSNEYDFYDALLGVSAKNLSLMYAADRTDLRAGVSAWVQAVQTTFFFRPIDLATFLTAGSSDVEYVREYMLSGNVLGTTFYGPVKFNALGQNAGRDTTTVQYDPVRFEGEEWGKVIFPAEHAQMFFRYPSPAVSSCGLNQYPEHATQACALCVANCTECPDNTDDSCACVQGFYPVLDAAAAAAARAGVLSEAPPACVACPGGATCAGKNALPVPGKDRWVDFERLAAGVVSVASGADSMAGRRRQMTEAAAVVSVSDQQYLTRSLTYHQCVDAELGADTNCRGGQALPETCWQSVGALLSSECVGDENGDVHAHILCHPSAKGPLCAVCLEGYSLDEIDNKCRSCRARQKTTLLAIIVVVLVAIIVASLVYAFYQEHAAAALQNVKGRLPKKLFSDSAGVYLRLIIAFFQIVAKYATQAIKV